MPDNTTASTPTASNGFFGTVLSGLGSGLNTIGSDVLPVWTKKQLGTGASAPAAVISNPAPQNMAGIATQQTAGPLQGITIGGKTYALTGVMLAAVIGVVVIFLARK